MRSTVKLGTISGIEIGLHYSWFIIAALIVLSLGGRFRQVNPDWSTGEIWIAALATAVLLLVAIASILIGVGVMIWAFVGAVVISALVGIAAIARGTSLIMSGISERNQLDNEHAAAA